MTVQTDYADFQTPGANAQAISVTGVPLLSLFGTVLTSVSYFLNGGANRTFGPFTVNQIGYEIFISAKIAAAATVPFLTATLTWFDGAGSFVVGQEEWIIPCGNTTASIITGSGPTKGAIGQLFITNLDPSAQATITNVMFQNSRVYIRDRWIENTVGDVPGFTSSGGNALAGILASLNAVTVGIGATVTRLFPLYAGDVWFYLDQGGAGAANFSFNLRPAPISFLGSGVMHSGNPSGGVGTGQGVVLRFPRAPIELQMTNSGTVASTVNCKVVQLDESH